MLATETEDSLSFIETRLIRPREGHNPRRHFSPAKMEELITSIRRQGVLQPIVVRPVDGGLYEIIAGERRFRAAQEIGLSEMPAVVRQADDLTAAEMAMVENTHRDDLAPSEEARKAREVLGMVEGDHAEAAKVLGWSRSKLDARLLLLHASEPVLAALDERRIALGHAELLATLPEKSQGKTLDSVIEKGVSVADLKARIAAIARELSSAIFDTAGCVGCPQNSSIQGDLFTASIGGGRCSGPACFNAKTLEALAERKASLAEQVPMVALDTERDPSTYTVIEATGPNGVGAEQLKGGCAACANFGCVLSTAPGEAGAVTEDVCFDLNCHAGKVKDYQAALAKPATPTGETATASTATGASAPRPAPAAKTETPKPASDPKKLIEHIDGRLRGIAATVSDSHPTVRRALAVHALWESAGQPDCSAIAGEPWKGHRLRRPDAVALLIRTPDDVIEALEARCARALLAETTQGAGTMHTGDELARLATAVIAATDTDLADHFTVDAAYLEAHQKSALEALLRESGFADAYAAAGTGKKPQTVEALAKKKVQEIIKAALDGATFDWSRFVPQALAARFKALAPRVLTATKED